MEQRTVTIKNSFRIADPDIQHRRMTYPPEQGYLHIVLNSLVSGCKYTKKWITTNNRRIVWRIADIFLYLRHQTEY